MILYSYLYNYAVFVLQYLRKFQICNRLNRILLRGLFMGVTFYAVFSQKFEEPKMRLARIVFLVGSVAYGAIGAGVVFGLGAYDSERLSYVK